ncbi:hemerythrin domain-containing protein [Actibacterium lipolyticum]|uniref:Hemerythrin-like domain-containing protein n=1 Tax=Actibacterium lipolyticum TaxID=1524263 RepID=A0A238JQ93_9RHOB|nr:hemerythrin domain-containing protein [Actibacterium lipolyticum]SMX32623.1 hypothetical protein COL8621_00862 [Actibacterium lipolyticum]
MTDKTELAQRDGLPDALRVLLSEYPRDMWESHRNFDGLTRFWLERHLMFRDTLARLQTEAEAMLDGKTDGRRYQHQTQRLAGFFLNQLHGHHQIEDHHYFPQLSALETKLESGFEILDADHHALDGYIHRMADTTNALLQTDPANLTDAAGEMHKSLLRFAPFLDRHLIDEEELIVPVILKHGQKLEG